MFRKKWEVAEFDKEEAVRIADEYDLDPFAALLLVSRGICGDDEIIEFLSEDLDFCNPFLLKDMEPAVARIRKAIDSFEKIAVYGDYDADGVTSTAMLYSYLKNCGADVVYLIPSREEDGYGLNSAAVERMSKIGVKLVITVDNGISAADEIAYGTSLGIDFVVTDHHQPPETLPDATAIVNPHCKDCPSTFKEWAGAGVALKLICALEECEPQELPSYYTALAAIGTVADLVSLTGENRSLVKLGLEGINTADLAPFKALREASALSDKKISSGEVAFMLAPRINAAGRMETADKAVKLLLTEDYDECLSLAVELDGMNRRRQQTEAEILCEAEEQVERSPDRKCSHFIVVEGEGWHPGVIGIVASRLVEKYGRPCLVLSTEQGVTRGSGRSIKGFSIYDALNAVGDCMLSYGGHTLAAGVTLVPQRVAELRQRLNDYCEALPEGMPFPTLRLDCRMNPAYLNLDVLDGISFMEPFGASNPQPLFGLFGMRIDSITPVGGGKHLRVGCSKKSAQVTAMLFGQGLDGFAYRTGDIVDLAVKIGKNVYAGKINLSVQIKDIRFHGQNEDLLFAGIRKYERFVRRAVLSQAEKNLILPTREDFALVYRFLRSHGGWNCSVEALSFRLNEMDYAKLCVILDAMEELQLISRSGERITLDETGRKVDLAASKILCDLKA